jgi:hypothetical protein
MSEPVRPQYPQREVRAEAEAALAARRELGPEYEDHIAAGLAERVEQLAAYRSAELQRTDRGQEVEREMERTAQRQGFVLGIISLGVGVPITAISAQTVDPSLLGVAVSWAGIVGVNLAHRFSRRRR